MSVTVVERGGRCFRYGWDAPLQYFHLTVEENGRVLYSNLDDADALAGPYGGGLTHVQLCAKLMHFGLSLEATEQARLKADMAHTSTQTRALAQLLEALSKQTI